MISERLIGGEMPIAATDLNGPAHGRVWPQFGKAHALRCDTGRSALWLALLDWRERTDSRGAIWVPSYVCDAVTKAIAPLERRVHVYPDRPGSADWCSPPDPATDDLVIVIHYFGIINRAALSWAAHRAGRTWSVLEDCVQAAYSQDAGVAGEYAVTSLRKWWPAPDGALVCASRPLAATPLALPDEEYISRRVAAKLLKSCGRDDATYLTWFEQAEQRLEGAAPRAVSWIATQLLSSADTRPAATARRANWSSLADGVARCGALQAVFADLAPGEVPLAFPMVVGEGRRDELRSFLAARRIYCSIHWKMPEGAAAADRDLSQRILSVPIDQRYGAADMQFILWSLQEFFRPS
jgi:hypothetical protein